MRRRMRDFGVRLALGAATRQIQASVHRRIASTDVRRPHPRASSSAPPPAWRCGSRAVRHLRQPTPSTYAGVFVVLAIASLLASYLPAWRAARVNVIEVLRQE